MDLIHVAQDIKQRWALVNMVVNLHVPYNVRNVSSK
jgi:hypothetical protein